MDYEAKLEANGEADELTRIFRDAFIHWDKDWENMSGLPNTIQDIYDKILVLFAARPSAEPAAEQRANIAEAEKNRVKAGLGTSLQDWMDLKARAEAAESRAAVAEGKAASDSLSVDYWHIEAKRLEAELAALKASAAFLAATPEQVEYLQKLKDDPKARVADRIRAAEIIADLATILAICDEDVEGAVSLLAAALQRERDEAAEKAIKCWMDHTDPGGDWIGDEDVDIAMRHAIGSSELAALKAGGGYVLDEGPTASDCALVSEKSLSNVWVEPELAALRPAPRSERRGNDGPRQA